MEWIGSGVAAVCMFILGGLWYGPFFGRVWMETLNLTEEDVKADKDGMALIYGTTFIVQIITAQVMEYLFSPENPTHGLMVGGLAGAFLASSALGVGYLFEGRPRKLFYINAGYIVVGYAIMGAILGLL